MNGIRNRIGKKTNKVNQSNVRISEKQWKIEHKRRYSKTTGESDRGGKTENKTEMEKKNRNRKKTKRIGRDRRRNNKNKKKSD